MTKGDRAGKPKGLTAGRVGRPRKAVTDRLDESLLDLAIQAMHDADFAEISLERLASRIGVSRPTLYRRFKNRDALLEAMVEREFSVLFQSTALPDTDPADPVATLRARARQMLDVFLRPATVNFVKFQSQESMVNPRLADCQRQWHLRVIDQLLPPIQQAQERDLFVRQDAGRLANLLIGLLDTPLALMNRGFALREALDGLSEEAFFDWRFGIFLDAAGSMPEPRAKTRLSLFKAIRRRRP